MKRDEVLRVLAASRASLAQFGVRRLSLFGSVARDEATQESDVDLLVEFDRPVGLFHFFRLRHYLEEILGTENVDLVMPEALPAGLKQGILREAIGAA
jgi:predicted nucleotidyltransferase